jgi:cytochrome oxidase assembly protein ShyY1
MLLAPRYWGAHLLMVLAVAASVALGLWQYDAWGAGRATEARDLSQASPRPIDQVIGGDDPFPGEDLGRPVSLRGEWLGAGTLYVADRQLDGKRGYWVVTPVMVGSSAMPVVRGWSAQPKAPVPSGEVEVEGWLQASEGSNARDDDPQDDVIPEMRIASIVEHVDADLYSAYVVARTTSFQPDQDLAPVTPESVPEVSDSTHLRNLLYAFQWWIFGAFSIYIWVRWCRDTMERSRAGTVEEEQVASSL